MRKWIGVLSVVLFLATFASADTLKLVSTPYGVNGPYSMSLNGSSTTTPMICYSDKNYITYGESWTVQAYTFNTLGALVGTAFGASTLQQTQFDYNLLGYLANQLFANPGNAGIQNAIWYVLGTGGSANSYYTAAFNFLNSHPGYMTTDVFYIPVGTFTSANGYPYGVPQPFIARAPEPGSLLLLGAGLLGLAGLRKRRLAP